MTIDPTSSPSFPDEHRPNLQPTDPRATASQSGEFTIMGSIDNETTFDLNSGVSKPSRF